MSVYPRPESWRQWSHAEQIAYLEQRIATEQETNRRLVRHWMYASKRIGEIEKERGEVSSAERQTPLHDVPD